MRDLNFLTSFLNGGCVEKAVYVTAMTREELAPLLFSRQVPALSDATT